MLATQKDRSMIVTEKVNSPMKPITERRINDTNTKQIVNIPATQTSYKTFYENPIEQEKKLNTMKPDFY